MIEVLLATRNGEATLGRTLEALARLQRPRTAWRLVVIDNGSTDGTPAVLARHHAHLPLTVLHEARPGKNAALNAAVPALGEGLALFLDDDILPEPDWLRAHEAAAEANPDRGVFAGIIRPHWDAPPPDWLMASVDLRICYGIHAEVPEGPCTPDVTYGGNLAIRSRLFRQGHRYDESYGPDATGNFAMGGETDLVRRLAAAGCGLWFVRGAVVRHIVSPEQMTRPWLLERARNFGRGQYRVSTDPLLHGRAAAISVRLRRAIAAARWRARVAGFLRKPKAQFEALWRAAYLSGLVIEHGNALMRGRTATESAGERLEALDS